jgi:hypothetical protein
VRNRLRLGARYILVLVPIIVTAILTPSDVQIPRSGVSEPIMLFQKLFRVPCAPTTGGRHRAITLHQQNTMHAQRAEKTVVIRRHPASCAMSLTAENVPIPRALVRCPIPFYAFSRTARPLLGNNPRDDLRSHSQLLMTQALKLGRGQIPLGGFQIDLFRRCPTARERFRYAAISDPATP